jgi:RES domain
VLDAALAAQANHVRWPAGRPFVRGHGTHHGALALNSTPTVRRFRPITDAGAVVPTAYGAETGTIALAETVLRRAAASTGVLHHVEVRGLSLAKVSFRHDLDLIQLNGLGLRKLGLTRDEVIDTANLAQVLYDANPDAQGIVWTSRQSDDGDAFILWGTRLDTSDASVLEGPLALDEVQGFQLVQRTCEQLGVLLVA